MLKMLEHVQLKSIKTCRVFHCPSAFAVALTTLDGYKIVYSGDTRPTDNIIDLGQDEEPTDLLIHEATMEHHMLEDAQVQFTMSISKLSTYFNIHVCEPVSPVLSHFE